MRDSQSKVKNLAKQLSESPIVVKFGGSLMDQVPLISTVLRSSHRPILIVPGGGPFADTVRTLPIGEDAAHWMAICGMEQYGWYIAAVGGFATQETIAVPEKPVVLLPYRSLRTTDPLPHSWNVTSDTIAAWVAAELHLDVVLLKSVAGIRVHGKIQEVISSPVSCPEVDSWFIPFILDHRQTAYVVDGRDPEQIAALAGGKTLRGTIIKG